MSFTGSSSNYARTHCQRHPKARDNGEKDDGYNSSADVSPGQATPAKAGRTHQELHKELLLAHKKGLVLSSKSELQKALERRKKQQSERTEGQDRETPLDKVLLKRQQTHLEREKKHEQQLWEGAELFEFIRVRQNLRKTQTPHKASDAEADAAE
ncbi:unnamed protein product [Gadus morhua 'NCC']|uniref:protein FAM107B n=1 Tax=Gadus chalcogrammus TaxID=1042646 RepID=UPI0024C2CC15|nr:protein FAM107B [Gadus chalcogrammus]XP_056450679.1 protein FAM107B [Gadus chalcogrammus]